MERGPARLLRSADRKSLRSVNLSSELLDMNRRLRSTPFRKYRRVSGCGADTRVCPNGRGGPPKCMKTVCRRRGAGTRACRLDTRVETFRSHFRFLAGRGVFEAAASTLMSMLFDVRKVST